MLGWGLPGVVFGASFILTVPDRVATVALGVLTLGLGVYSFSQKSFGLEERNHVLDLRGKVIGGLGLCLIGVLNGSLTSGTGLFVTLWLVRWFGLDYKKAVAYTLVLVGVFWNGAGAIVLGTLGEVRWSWMPALIAGSLIGGYLGAHLAILKGNVWIKRSFELLTVAVGLKLIVG